MTAAPGPAAPAASSPTGKTIGIIAGIVAGLAVLAVGGYFGYRLLFPAESSSPVATSEVPPVAAAPTAVPGSRPAKDVVATPPVQDSVSMQSAPANPEPAAKPAAKEPLTVADFTGQGPAKTPGTAAAMDASKAAPTKGATAALPPGSSSAPATEAPAMVAQGSAPSKAPDRWREMREAMARCAGDNFFKRVACEQGVGQQYCEGFWGKVPQCPSGPSARDRGQ